MACVKSDVKDRLSYGKIMDLPVGFIYEIEEECLILVTDHRNGNLRQLGVVIHNLTEEGSWNIGETVILAHHADRLLRLNANVVLTQINDK